MNRIHVSAGTGNPLFTEEQVKTMETILNKYFKGWLRTEGTRCWDGHVEQLRTYSIPVSTSRKERSNANSDGLASFAASGPTNLTGDAFRDCIAQLRMNFPYAFLLLEADGVVYESEARKDAEAAEEDKPIPVRKAIEMEIL